MKISVVIPAYNAEIFILNALNSVEKQTLCPHEIFVINDGSIDNTQAIVSNYAAHHQKLSIVLIDQENKGIGAARNRGIHQASGDIISFLDADDVWYPKKLERIHLIYEEQPDIDVIYHAAMEIMPNETRKKTKHLPLPIHAYTFLLLYGNQLITSATSVKKRSIKEAGYFSTDMQYNSAEDYDLWLKLARNSAKFYYIDEIYGEYKKSTASISSKLLYHSNKCYNVSSHHLRYLHKKGMINKTEYENHLFYQRVRRDYKITIRLLHEKKFFAAIKQFFSFVFSKGLSISKIIFLYHWFNRNKG